MIFKRNKNKMPKVKNGNGINKRKYMGVMLIALAAVLAFVVMPMIYSSKEEVKTVVVAGNTVAKGDKLTKKNLRLQERGIYGQEEYFTDIKEIEKCYAALDIVKGDIITSAKTAKEDSKGLSAVTKEGKKLISISVATNAAGLVQHLKSGDLVNVWVMAENEWGELSPVLYPELTNMSVYGIENQEGENLAESKKNITEISGSSSIVSTVTLFVDNDEQVKKLLSGEYGGKLHIELVDRP